MTLLRVPTLPALCFSTGVLFWHVLTGVRQRRVCYRQLHNLISAGWMWHPNRPYKASSSRIKYSKLLFVALCWHSSSSVVWSQLYEIGLLPWLLPRRVHKLAVQLIARHLSCVEAETQRFSRMQIHHGQPSCFSKLLYSGWDKLQGLEQRTGLGPMLREHSCSRSTAMLLVANRNWEGKLADPIMLGLPQADAGSRIVRGQAPVAWPGAVPRKARSQGSPSARASCYRPAQGGRGCGISIQK